MEKIEKNIYKKSKSGEYKDRSRALIATKYVINDILNGATWSVLRDKLMNDDYEIGHKYSEPQSQRIVRKAREVIKQDINEQMPELREETMARILDVYTECRELGDRMNALKALDMINKMFGQYQDKLKIDADVKQEIVIDFGYDKDNSKD